MRSSPPLAPYLENWAPLFKRGPFAGGRPSRSSSVELRFRVLSGDAAAVRSASRGIGMPLSRGLSGKDGDGGTALVWKIRFCADDGKQGLDE